MIRVDNQPGGRYYERHGVKYRSVTALIDAGLPKPALINWAAKYTAEYALEHLDELNTLAEADRQGAIDWLKSSKNRRTKAAADQGSDLHAAVEAYVLGQPYEIDPEVDPAYMQGFLDFLEDMQPEFEMTEASVFSEQHYYAGTLDFIATVLLARRRQKILVDVKTGGVYPEVGLQLAAYRHADFVAVGDEDIPMPEVEGGAVLQLTPKGYVWIEVDCSDDVFKKFLYVREVARFSLEGSKEVLGRRIKRAKVPKGMA